MDKKLYKFINYWFALSDIVTIILIDKKVECQIFSLECDFERWFIHCFTFEAIDSPFFNNFIIFHKLRHSRYESKKSFHIFFKGMPFWDFCVVVVRDVGDCPLDSCFGLIFSCFQNDILVVKICHNRAYWWTKTHPSVFTLKKIMIPCWLYTHNFSKWPYMPQGMLKVFGKILVFCCK